uniref:NADH-ubiquinone oxidoreductase chain 3 n=1 Tax=Habrotrocha constricta TaxID=104786 RepID=J7KCR0_HABCO|nr:NADH dehydrogenase subunit 3 [Habrotrocha constricta]
MWVMMIYLLISLVVPAIMGLASMMMSSKFMSSDGFECGFDSFNVSVFPVSLRFFIFCIIFLILELELIIMSVTPFIMWASGFIINIVVFLFLVTFSMMMEWLYGSLSWVE